MNFEKELKTIITSEYMDNLDSKIIPGVEYHFDFLDGFYENNSLYINENNQIVFNFVFSASQIDYRGAISAYTYLNILDGCIHNEFAEDLTNGDINISLDKDFSDPEFLSLFATLISNDTDISDFIDRITFVSLMFFAAEEIFNETIEKAALSAGFLQIASPSN